MTGILVAVGVLWLLSFVVVVVMAVRAPLIDNPPTESSPVLLMPFYAIVDTSQFHGSPLRSSGHLRRVGDPRR